MSEEIGVKPTEYYYEEGEDYITFEDGELSASTYSYNIDSNGFAGLDETETRKLYEVMKTYYQGE